MTTYRKAWLFNAVWVPALLVIVGPLAWSYFDGPEPLVGNAIEIDLEMIVVAAFGVMLVLGFVANSYPKCPHCEHPVNMAEASEVDQKWWTGGGIPMMRPQRPPKTCGYCGFDLTVPYDSE